jgi:hypothetical protein
MLPRAVVGIVVLAVLIASDNPAAENPQQCREALAAYNEMVVAVHAAARAYERCVKASLGLDDCGADYIELQVTQRDFELAIDERQAKCRTTE